MNRSIYLVVLKCTGRTCNGHPVIGGEVVASPWYVYKLLEYIFQYVYSLISSSLMYLFIFLFYIHENRSKSVFDRFGFASWQFFFDLAADGKGLDDYFGTML